jgi:hypothetical protein
MALGPSFRSGGPWYSICRTIAVLAIGTRPAVRGATEEKAP